jgi:hypothetical protein
LVGGVVGADDDRTDRCADAEADDGGGECPELPNGAELPCDVVSDDPETPDVEPVDALGLDDAGPASLAELDPSAAGAATATPCPVTTAAPRPTATARVRSKCT